MQKADKPSAILPHHQHGHHKFKTVPFHPHSLAAASSASISGQKTGLPLHDAIRKVKAGLFQEESDVERVICDDQFENWGKTISFCAGYTLVVRTIAGVCEVVKWAASESRRVRVAGFRHSWT